MQTKRVIVDKCGQLYVWIMSHSSLDVMHIVFHISSYITDI